MNSFADKSETPTPRRNPAIPEDVRRAYAEAIRVARAAAGGPAGASEIARRSMLDQLGDDVIGDESMVGKGAGAFRHEYVTTSDMRYVLDPVARQVLEGPTPLTTRVELEARGLLTAVEEGIFTYEQWQKLRSLETSPTAAPTAPRFRSRGGRFIATRAAGALLLSGGAVVAVTHLFSAPRHAMDSPAPFSCDCMGIEAGLLTSGWRDACMAREKEMAAIVGSAWRLRDVADRLGLEGDENSGIVGGELCEPAGPKAWPVSSGPVVPPAGLPAQTHDRCKPEGIVMKCE